MEIFKLVIVHLIVNYFICSLIGFLSPIVVGLVGIEGGVGRRSTNDVGFIGIRLVPGSIPGPTTFKRLSQICFE